MCDQATLAYCWTEGPGVAPPASPYGVTDEIPKPVARPSGSAVILALAGTIE
jgi:hypothetical protein